MNDPEGAFAIHRPTDKRKTTVVSRPGGVRMPGASGNHLSAPDLLTSPLGGDTQPMLSYTFAADTVCIGHETMAYAAGGVAIGNGAVSRTPNEVAVRAFGRTVRFHHHQGIAWRTFTRGLRTRAGIATAVWLVSHLGGRKDWR